MKRRLAVVGVAMIGVWACGQGTGGSGDAAAADTLTRREKDSVLSTAPLPGAGKIMDARRAVDRANERTLQHDTVG